MISSIFRMSSLSKLALLVLGVLGAATIASATQLNLASGQVGVAYSDSVPAYLTPAPSVTTTYSATGLPTGLAINSSSGAISGTPTVSGTFNTGLITLTDGAVTNNFTYTVIIAPALGTPVITSPTSALGAVGSAFTYTVTASNSPTSFNVGALPGGLTYDGVSVISGTPTVAGSYTVSLSANNASGSGSPISLAITIDPAGPVPVITSSTAVSATTLNVPFSYQITASNSPTSFTAGNLPVGLSVNTSTGLISGTPTVPGVSLVPLTATNGNGVSATVNLTITLGPISSITSAASLSGYKDIAITPYQVTGDNSPTSFNVGALPAGLTYSAVTKQITGTPTAVGATNVTLSANNATGTGSNFTLGITIAQALPPTINTSPLTQAVNLGGNVTLTVGATGTPTPTYQWQKGGVNISLATSSSYTITGATLGDAGSYTVVVTNIAGTATSDPAVITINALPQVITFGAIADLPFTATPFNLTATSDSSLTVAFTLNSGPATLSGTQLTLTGTGTVSITATQAGNGTYAAATPVTRTFNVTPDFASWQLGIFSPTELGQLSVSGPNAVYGQDGLPNLVKYALGLDPKTNITTGLPTLTKDATNWIYTYTRPTGGQPDVTYTVEISTNLTTWTSAGVTQGTPSNSGGVDTIAATYPLASANNIFFRLNVTRP